MLVRGWALALSVWVSAGCRAPADSQVAAYPAGAGVGVPVAALVHRVASGETLYGIARAHGLSVATLRALNPDVEVRRLRAGQALRLPARDEEPRKKPLLRAIRGVD